jgi:alpha-D-ribose 1-methylphosphonate 5-triphosphate diphosphatase PhnM
VPDVGAKASSNVANSLGFDDHGERAPGKRADLVRVTLVKDVPVVGDI